MITGALHLIGIPGGIFHLRRGALVAVDSPGAPGADALLLRSGRISESDWTEALRAGAETRSHQAELVARGSIRATELHVLSTMAAQDGTFSAFAGTAERYIVTTEPVDVLLPVTVGIDVDWLLRETSRRLDALASLRFPVSPFRDKVAPVPDVVLPASARTALRQEILDSANGRRSSRDIAFLIGRSVYSVTVEISRMLGEGLMEVVPGTSVATPSTVRTMAPRVSPEAAGAGRQPSSGLPQRQPGASRITDDQAALKSPGQRPLPRWRRRIRAGPTPPETTGSLFEPERNDLEP
jgi:hypothetical protein